MACLELGMKVKDKVTDCSSWYVASRFIVLND